MPQLTKEVIADIQESTRIILENTKFDDNFIQELLAKITKVLRNEGSTEMAQELVKKPDYKLNFADLFDSDKSQQHDNMTR